jgi:hypothetical protein
MLKTTTIVLEQFHMYSFVLFDSQAEDHAIGGEEGGGLSTAIESGEKVSISASVAKDD